LPTCVKSAEPIEKRKLTKFTSSFRTADVLTMMTEVESSKSEPFAEYFHLYTWMLCPTQKPEPARPEPETIMGHNQDDHATFAFA
jgi:hypothetical protein